MEYLKPVNNNAKLMELRENLRIFRTFLDFQYFEQLHGQNCNFIT